MRRMDLFRIAGAVAILLAGCVTEAPPVISDKPAPLAIVQTVCPPIKTYSAAEQKAMAGALAALPPNNPLVGAITDYGTLRAAVRACASTPP